MLFGNMTKGNWGIGMRPRIFGVSAIFGGCTPWQCRLAAAVPPRESDQNPHAADPRRSRPQRTDHQEEPLHRLRAADERPRRRAEGRGRVVGAASGARHVLARCLRAGSRRRWTTASRAAPPGGRCSTCCATRDLGRARHRGALLRRREAGRRGLVRAYTDAGGAGPARGREGADRAPGDAALRGAVCDGGGCGASSTPPGEPARGGARAGGGAVLQPARGCRRSLRARLRRVGQAGSSGSRRSSERWAPRAAASGFARARIATCVAPTGRLGRRGGRERRKSRSNHPSPPRRIRRMRRSSAEIATCVAPA